MEEVLANSCRGVPTVSQPAGAVVSGPVNSTGLITAFFKRRERRTNRRSTAVTRPYWQRLAATLAAVVAAGLSGVATFAPSW